MSRLYLRVLGKPELLLNDVPIDRMRTRRLWGVLAYLALSPTPIPRALLAQTFWPDVDDPRVNLRVALHQLRADYKNSPIEDDGKYLRLIDGVRCDVLELTEALQSAKRAADRSERRRLLERAAERERGHFLEGFDGDWVLQQRARLFTQCRELLEELMILQREDGDLEAASKTAVNLLRYWPDHPEATRLALTQTDHAALAERATVGKLLSTSLSSWSPSRIHALRSLAVFPSAFTAEAACTVAGIRSKDLDEAVQFGIVIREEGRLSLEAYTRDELWGQFTEGQRRRIRRTHAQWTIDSLLQHSPDRHAPIFVSCLKEQQSNSCEGMLSPDEICRYVIEVDADLHAACRYGTEFGDLENADIFFLLLCDYVRGERHQFARYTDLLTRNWKTVQSRPYYPNAVTLLASLSLRERNLILYFQEFLESFVDADHSLDPDMFQAMTETALIFFHYNGEDDEFDRVLRQRIELLKRFPDYPITPTAHHTIAENSLARRRHAYALLHNDRYCEYWRERNDPNSLAVGLLQRGGIFRGLRRNHEVAPCWNEALLLFEESGNVHGQASCFEALASLRREDRTFAEAQALLRLAIKLFQQSGDDAAVHAAEGSLGDVLRDRGVFDEAEKLYRQGLEFWERRGHTRWVNRFEARLTNLNERRGMSIK